MSRARWRWSFTNEGIDVEAEKEQISIEYEKGVVSRGFDHDGHDGVPVETENKGNTSLIFTQFGQSLKNVTCGNG